MGTQFKLNVLGSVSCVRVDTMTQPVLQQITGFYMAGGGRFTYRVSCCTPFLELLKLKTSIFGVEKVGPVDGQYRSP